MVLALFVLLGFAPAVASARPAEDVGMCGDLAQSIEAPPPLYPAEHSTLDACDSVDESRGISQAPRPADEPPLVPDLDPHHDWGVIGLPLELAGAAGVIVPLVETAPTIAEEHRLLLERPPIA